MHCLLDVVISACPLLVLTPLRRFCPVAMATILGGLFHARSTIRLEPAVTFPRPLVCHPGTFQALASLVQWWWCRLACVYGPLFLATNLSSSRRRYASYGSMSDFLCSGNTVLVMMVCHAVTSGHSFSRPFGPRVTLLTVSQLTTRGPRAATLSFVCRRMSLSNSFNCLHSRLHNTLLFFSFCCMGSDK